MMEDGGGHLTWRVAVDVQLAGRRFGSIKLDISPRAHELDATDIVTVPNALEFAGVATIEIVDIHRHAAEKLHGMLRQFGSAPAGFPNLPPGWPRRYELLAAENRIDPPSFAAAIDAGGEPEQQ